MDPLLNIALYDVPQLLPLREALVEEVHESVCHLGRILMTQRTTGSLNLELMIGSFHNLPTYATLKYIGEFREEASTDDPIPSVL